MRLGKEFEIWCSRCQSDDMLEIDIDGTVWCRRCDKQLEGIKVIQV